MRFQKKSFFCILFCYIPHHIQFLMIRGSRGSRKIHQKLWKQERAQKSEKFLEATLFPVFIYINAPFLPFCFQKTTFLREKLSFYPRKLSRISESCSNSSCIGSIWANIIFRFLPVILTSEFQVKNQNLTIFKSFSKINF